ncbi:hypothetical protein A4H02_08660 [Fervidobacterium thailandense]|uniref:Uncharacterized protein n=1 Tax=Fervidobacterium thailandense TaxID=1008305 RepID=A0A1E3G0R1_9BACT|nr:hypothetical protein A4H02_08660 [Fervidobacterium thailandense]
MTITPFVEAKFFSRFSPANFSFKFYLSFSKTSFRVSLIVNAKSNIFASWTTLISLRTDVGELHVHHGFESSPYRDAGFIRSKESR